MSVTTDPLQRTRFLPAHVEILLAASEIDEARQAADELGALADRYGMDVLGAMAQHAKGAVALAEGDARGAIDALRRAQEVWQRVGAPYLSARIRLLVARAFRALGDEDGAALEIDAAKKVFVQLGAAPDVRAAEALATSAATTAAGTATDTHGLSPRELEVLRLVATGKTNKTIAGELFLSEKTVDRHVSNIFGKLNVSSRTAATAWAYQHRIMSWLGKTTHS
jgi:DNA-binding NarL/FixJ family response regulator